MAESINLKGMLIRGFEEKQRSRDDKTSRWFVAMLRNEDGDSMTIRTDKRILLKLIAGEKVDVIISQAQTRLGDVLDSEKDKESILEFKKGKGWIPEKTTKDGKRGEKEEGTAVA